MSDLTRYAEAWPRLADGLFDWLADIDTPEEALADLDTAIHAARLVAEAREPDYEAATLNLASVENDWDVLPSAAQHWYRMKAHLVVNAALGVDPGSRIKVIVVEEE